LGPQSRYLKQLLTLLVVGGFIGPEKALLGVAPALVDRRHVSPDAVVARHPVDNGLAAKSKHANELTLET
jgi:hypothetical protein